MDKPSDFSIAQQKVKELTTKPSDKVLLDLYSLYKQATIGNCNTSKPWAIDVKNKMKWDAWNSRKGMKTEEAEQEYVKLVEELVK